MSGHGAAQHWKHQRVTAVLNIPLMLWLVWSVTHMASWSHADFTAWLATPLHAGLMIVALLSVLYHAALGTQVIAEDYISDENCRRIKIRALRAFFVVSGLVCIAAVLKVAFAG